MDKVYEKSIDQNIVRWQLDPEHAREQTRLGVAMQLGHVAMQFTHIERIPRYDNGERENDAEHSFMLSLVASELAYMIYPDDLNPLLVGQYAVVHDLIELKTGDVPTFHLSPEEIIKKEQDERHALTALLTELPPYISNLVQCYESQIDKESRFVRAVDKLLPVMVDIIGDGKRIMNEDYGVYDDSALLHGQQKLHARIAEKFSEFPELIADHKRLCQIFYLQF
jgi:5'-deoxynucleotidase YfbR-like HD superfamily hydrolase